MSGGLKLRKGQGLEVTRRFVVLKTYLVTVVITQL